MEKIDICTYTLEKLIKEMVQMKEKPFKAKQIYTWIHKRYIWDFDLMTDLNKDLRERLKEKFTFTQGEIIEEIEDGDKTSKYLVKFKNNSIIESVLMEHSFGNSVCVSSQVGCNMGCAFCYSTKDGKQRDLTSSEMLYQVYKIQEKLGERISNVVIMGSGEPLENYGNTLDFINILTSKEGTDLGIRHITLSTCGLVDKMYDLADKKMQINLAISLHGPNNEIRKEIMPIAGVYSIEELLKACDYYTEQTGRRITYEYALMEGINDSIENAKELAKRLKGKLCHVNLIPVNEIKGGNFKKPSQKRVKEFADRLEYTGITVTIRRELGSSISAACGQLRGSKIEDKNLEYK